MSEGISYRAAILIQLMVAAVAVGAGGTVGWTVGKKSLEKELFVKYGMSSEDMFARLTRAEKDYADLYARCEPLEGSEKDELSEARDKVESLKKQVTVREAEIARLEVKARENVSLRKDLERRKAELVELKGKLEVAEQEKARLEERLQEAVMNTNTARAERDVARNETVDSRWSEFKAGAQLAICEKGNRKKLGNCRETVAEALNGDRERRYRECVQRKAAVPQLREIRKDEKNPPAFAEWLNPGSKFTKGWYILYCDPTLPEAGDGASRSNPANPRSGSPVIPDLDEPSEGEGEARKDKKSDPAR
jgi:hypothetical protein